MPSAPTEISPPEHAADEALRSVSERFRLVSSLTPTNLRAERTAFFAGSRQNLHFTYAVDQHSLATLRSELDTIAVPRTEVGALLEAKRLELQKKVDLLAAIGTPQFSELSRAIYGVPDATTIEEAHSVLAKPHDARPEPTEEPRLSAQAVADALNDVLARYKLEAWTVELNERSVAGVVVNPQERRIFVAAHTSLEVSRLAPLITHEIETHVLTAENGRVQPLSLFVQGFAGYLATQEGLAAYNVSIQHPQHGRPMRFWARNALAVDLAQRHGFRDVFEAVRDLGFTEQFAFGVAAKVKRGLIDTSEPGGWTKDYIYLAGRRAVADFVAGGGGLRDLYVGKISLEVVPELRHFSWVKPPKLLPQFLQ
ncbi:MAG: DUF1704 domain-containing protein [Candidatus Andersenbacteria bacterium]